MITAILKSIITPLASAMLVASIYQDQIFLVVAFAILLGVNLAVDIVSNL